MNKVLNTRYGYRVIVDDVEEGKVDTRGVYAHDRIVKDMNTLERNLRASLQRLGVDAGRERKR